MGLFCHAYFKQLLVMRYAEYSASQGVECTCIVQFLNNINMVTNMSMCVCVWFIAQNY